MYVYIGGSKEYGDEVSEDKELVIMLTYAGVCWRMLTYADVC
jgi:hypothetical protein